MRNAAAAKHQRRALQPLLGFDPASRFDSFSLVRPFFGSGYRWCACTFAQVFMAVSYGYIHSHVCIQSVYTYIYTDMCICVQIHVYIYIYIYMQIVHTHFVGIYMNIHTGMYPHVLNPHSHIHGDSLAA